MNENPDEINNPDRALEAKLYGQAQDYAETRVRSKELNKQRAENRKRIEEMGIRKDAYQVGIRVVKDLSATEQKDFIRDLQLTIKTLGKRQQDLFPEEALKIAKRLDRVKKSAAAQKAELDAKSDANPKSDPKRGGAGKRTKAAPPASEMAGGAVHEPGTAAGDALIKDVADKLAAEQAEGESVLNAGLTETRKSQSAIAAEKLEAAKLN